MSDTRRAIRGGSMLFAFALPLTVSLTACGGEEESAGSEALNVIISSPDSITYAGGQEGNQLGAWKDTNLKVKVIEGDSVSATQALASGDADIAFQAGVRAAASIAQGLDASIIGATQLPSSQLIVVSNEVKSDDPADLKGATFGISGFGSSGDFSVHQLSEQYNWTRKKDIKVVALGGINEITAALKSGDIDAFTWSSAAAFDVQSRGYGRIIGNISDYTEPYGSGTVVATNAVIKERPDDVRALMQGYYGLVKRMQADPSILEDVMVNDWKTDPTAAKNAIDTELENLTTDGKMSREVLDSLRDATSFSENVSTNPADYYRYWGEL